MFFGNSGAEANEAAIKLARRWGMRHGGGRFEIISTHQLLPRPHDGTLSATGQEKYHQGFQPMLPGFTLVPLRRCRGGRARGQRADRRDDGRADSGRRRRGDAESRDYLARLRELCDRDKLLLIFDEVQVGMGRTGKMFAHEQYGVKPDIMTLAKALGGGIADRRDGGAARNRASLTPGTHGTTFGGNPVACASALAVLDALEQDDVIENAAAIGSYLIERLREIAKSARQRREVRGQGMIIGVVLKHEAQSVVDACLKERLIVNATAGNVLRLLPPLNLTREQADEGLAIIERALTARGRCPPDKAA